MPETPLARAVAALHAGVPDLDGTSLAEALWLASLMASDERAPEPAAVPDGGAATPSTVSAEGAERPAGSRTSHAAAPEPVGGGGERALHERLSGSGARITGDPVSASRASGLPEALEVTRALRPWKRPWREGRRRALDIEATVDAYARSGELIPAFTPAPERWFDLVLVVDRSPAMRVWRETIGDFTAVLDRLGAFRTLQVRDLTFDGDQRPELRGAQGTLTSPGQLRSPDARRLVVVVSDCAAPAWREAAVWRLVREWSLTTPVALLDPLPVKLWRGTGLNLPTVRVGAGAPGAPNAHLPFEAPVLLPQVPDGDTWLPVPVLSLSPHTLDRWSRTVMRGAPEGCGAVLVPSGGRVRGPGSRRPAVAGTDERRAEGFVRTAAPAAVRLAVLSSTFDRLSLRLLQIIRRELVPEATTADVAELLTSGLFVLDGGAGVGAETVGGAEGTVELSLPAAVQERLRKELAEHEVWRINRAISWHVSSQGDGRGQLPAVAHNPVGGTELAAGRGPFGQASARTLELLGLSGTGGETVPATDGMREDDEARDVGRPSQLPRLGDALFVGRANEMRTVTALLTAPGSPVVGVTATKGPFPGTGKTVFAVRAAHAVKEQFPDGQLFVDLRRSTDRPLDASAALNGFLLALGVNPELIPEDVEGRAILYRATLAGRRVLVVLDDAADAAQVTSFLPDTSGCAVLVTGRRMREVRVDGMVEVDLPPLVRESAVALTEQLVGEAFPNLPKGFAPQVVEYCGGWPLRLALVSSWLATATEPFAALDSLRGLSDLFSHVLEPILDARLRDLDVPLRTALLLLSLPDAVHLTAYEVSAVLGADYPDAVDTVETLVRVGLIERSGQERFRYHFHNGVHAYVRGRASHDLGVRHRGEAERRLLNHYRDAAVRTYTTDRPGDRLAERLALGPGYGAADGADVPARAGIDWFLVEAPNALAALTPRKSISPGTLGARTDVLLLLRDLAQSPPHAGQYRDAALHLARVSEIDTPLSHARAHLALAHSYLGAGLFHTAAVTLNSTPYLASDPATVGLVAQLRGTIVQEAGEYETAEGHFLRARSVAQENDDLYAEATALHSLALLHLEAGRFHVALNSAVEAQQRWRTLGATTQYGQMLYVLAEVHETDGAQAEALETHRQALRLFRSHGRPRWQALVRLGMARTLLATGAPEDALDSAYEALRLLGTATSYSRRAEAETLSGRALADLGRTEEARTRWHQALMLYRMSTDPDPVDVAGVEALLAATDPEPVTEPPHDSDRLTDRTTGTDPTSVAAPGPAGLSTLVAVGIEGFARRGRAKQSAMAEIATWTLRGVLTERGISEHLLEFRSEDDGVILVTTARSVPLATVLHALLDDLPWRLDDPGLRLNIAVDSGPTEAERDRSDIGLVLALLRHEEPFTAGGTSGPVHKLIVSERAMREATHHPDAIFFPGRFAPVRLRSAPLTGVRAHIQLPNPVDDQVRLLREAFLDADADGHRMAHLIRDCMDAVIESAPAGRGDLSDAPPSMLAALGVEVARETRHEFDLDGGNRLTMRMADVEFDVHFSLLGPNWLIPPEAVNEICLVVLADESRSVWSAGLVRVQDKLLEPGLRNQDAPRALRPSAVAGAVEWLHQDAELPENLLVSIPGPDRAAILSRGSGTERLAELFRRVRNRPIPIATVRTVARQPEVARRIRDARRVLDAEGITVLGHRPDDLAVAERLGVPAPGADEWVSVRVEGVDGAEELGGTDEA